MAASHAEVPSVRNTFAYIGKNDFVSSVTNEEPLWTASIISTDDANHILWDDDEDRIRRQIDELIKVFHTGRYLHVKQLPKDITEKELRTLFGDKSVQSIQLSAGTGTAKVYLSNYKEYESFERTKQWTIKGQKISVVPSATESMLCVASLPTDYSEDGFVQLVQRYGSVRKCFLMRSERTGESKGYGFVEYENREIAVLAKGQLDHKVVNNSQLTCDWLDPARVTFDSLHSTCLKVQGLPKDYRDMAEFRQIFSVVVNPPYCQIALKQGRPQDFGLVEYNNWEEAQKTLEDLQGHVIKGSPIKITYCIPGVRAIHIYMKLMTEPEEKGQTALLPEPPANTVMKQLQNLMKHNPQFAQNLQNIVLEQIQSLQNGSFPSNKSQPQGKKYGHKNGSRFDSRSGYQPFSDAPDVKGLNSLLGNQLLQSPNLCNNIQMMTLLQQMVKSNTGASPSVLCNGSKATAVRSSDWTAKGNNYNPSSGQHYDSSCGSSVLNALLGYAASAGSSHGNQGRHVNHGGYHSPPQTHGPNTYYQGGSLGESGSHQDLQDTINTLFTNAQNLKQLLNNLNTLLGPHNSPPSPPLFGVAGQNSLVSSLLQSSRRSSGATDTPFHSGGQDTESDITSPYTNNYVDQLASLLALQSPNCPLTPDRCVSPYSGWTPGLGGSSRSPSSYSTPHNKRKHNHILPSPEPSPENGYIGQHSQGIGGHYADSYGKRKKKH